MGLKVTTDGKSVMVFRKDFEKNGTMIPSYSIGISSKTPDGDWIKGYIPARFKKGVEVSNMAKIHIKTSFPVMSKYKDTVYKSLMITEFEVEEENKDGFMDIPEGLEDTIPFK